MTGISAVGARNAYVEAPEIPADASLAGVAGRFVSAATIGAVRAITQAQTSLVASVSGPYAAMPSSSAASVNPAAIAIPEAGYASSGAAAAPQGIAMTATTSPAPTARELAFLDDKKLSIQDKLFMFIALMTKKTDQQLTDAMKVMADKKSSSSSSTKASTAAAAPAATDPASATGAAGSASSPDGGADAATAAGNGIAQSVLGSGPAPFSANLKPPYDDMTWDELRSKFDMFQITALLAGRDPNGIDLGSAFSRVGDALEAAGQGALDGVLDAAADLAGPVLAAVATAMGQPWLAPFAMTLGKDLGSTLRDSVESALTADAAGAMAVDAGGGSASSAAANAVATTKATATTSSSTKSSTSSTTSAADAAADDQIGMLNLQRLMNAQNAMFSALSNVLKSTHDTQMAAIQNLK